MPGAGVRRVHLPGSVEAKLVKKVTLLNNRAAVRLSMDGVGRLIEAISSDIDDPKRRVEIEVGFEGTTISESSFAELKNHVSSLPDRIQELSVTLSADGGRYIKVQMYQNFVQTYVTGDDGAWVRGKDGEIAVFLRRHRPWYVSTSSIFVAVGLCGGIVVSVLLPVAALRQNVALLFTAIIILAVCVTLLVFINRLFPYVDIRVRNDRVFKLETVASWAIILTFLLTVWIAIETLWIAIGTHARR